MKIEIELDYLKTLLELADQVQDKTLEELLVVNELEEWVEELSNKYASVPGADEPLAPYIPSPEIIDFVNNHQDQKRTLF